MSPAVSVKVLADGVPIDCGGIADGLAACYGALPAIGIAAAAALGGAAVAVYTAFALIFPRVLSAMLGVPTPGTESSVGRRTSPPGQTQAGGARVVSAHLENADVFRTAKAAGTTPSEPAVLVLKNRPDFDKRDFDRKARDLARLGQEGKLKKAASDRDSNKVYDPSTGKRRTRTNIYRDRMIRNLTKDGRLTQDKGTLETNKYLANKNVVERLYAGKGPITARGQGYDPDHIQELQLDGTDTYDNLRPMDAWTNRELGREISIALRNVPEGTPVIVRVIP